MKNNLLRMYLLSFFLLIDFVAFAEDPVNPDEGGDPPVTPINGKLIWLVIAAIIFVFYSYKRKIKAA